MPKKDRLECDGQSRNWTNILAFLVMPLLVVAVIVFAAWPTKAAPPIAFDLYCLRNVAECPSTGARVVKLTPTVRATIERIHRQVNAEIRPRRDTNDVWSADVRYGDCDDYVMTKRRRLIKAGVPATAMDVVVTRANGEGHVVLVVRTTGGRFWLDNLRQEVSVLRG